MPLQGHRVIAGWKRVNREIIRPLEAWDRDKGAHRVLGAGATVSGCRIVRGNAPGAEAYTVELDCAGRRYHCPLYAFQARTQGLPATADEECVELAAAVRR